MASIFTKITAESAGSTPFEFNSITLSTDNTMAPSDEQVQVGSYSYKTEFGGTDSAAYGTEIFSDQDECYFSLWYYIHADFNMQADYRYSKLFEVLDGGTDLVAISIRRNSTSVDRYQIGGDDLAWTYPTDNYSTGTWHHLEVYYKVGASGDGICRVWIDDDLLFEDTGVANSTRLVDRVKVGGDGHAPADGSIVYYDEIEGHDEMPSGGETTQISLQSANGTALAHSLSTAKSESLQSAESDMPAAAWSIAQPITAQSAEGTIIAHAQSILLSAALQSGEGAVIAPSMSLGQAITLLAAEGTLLDYTIGTAQGVALHGAVAEYLEWSQLYGYISAIALQQAAGAALDVSMSIGEAVELSQVEAELQSILFSVEEQIDLFAAEGNTYSIEMATELSIIIQSAIARYLLDIYISEIEMQQCAAQLLLFNDNCSGNPYNHREAIWTLRP